MPKFLNLIQYVDDGADWETNPNDNTSGLRTIKLSQHNKPGTTIMRDSNGRAEISYPVNDEDIANKKFVTDAVATGQNNFPLTTGEGEYSVVQRRIKSNGSVVKSEAYQRGSMSVGGGTVAGDKSGTVTDYSFAFAANENNEAIARSSAAFGRYNTTHNPGEFVCGSYSEENRNPETVFLVGGGSQPDKRHNAFEVRTAHDGAIHSSKAFIGGKQVATEDYVGSNAVHKEGTPYVVYVNETDGKSAVIPYRFQEKSIIDPEYTIMFQPMVNGRLYCKTPNDKYHVANKYYVDNTCVKLTGTQHISGEKVFFSKTNLRGGATVPYDSINSDGSVANKKFVTDAVATSQNNFSLENGDGQFSVVQKRIKSNGSTVTTKAYQRGTAAFGGSTVAGDQSGTATDYSFAFAANENNEAIARSSAAFGRYNKTFNPGEFVCGNYSDNNRNPETVFLVGGGSQPDKRHNAFEVRTAHDGAIHSSKAFIGGKQVATEDYVGSNAVHKEGTPYVVYVNETDGKSAVIPYRFQEKSIINPEYTIMFQPMVNGRLWCRTPEKPNQVVNKGYVDGALSPIEAITDQFNFSYDNISSYAYNNNIMYINIPSTSSTYIVFAQAAVLEETEYGNRTTASTPLIFVATAEVATKQTLLSKEFTCSIDRANKRIVIQGPKDLLPSGGATNWKYRLFTASTMRLR